MTPQEAQMIFDLLMNRVQPQNAKEGVAIANLAAKLLDHFTPKPKATRPTSVVKVDER